MRTSSLCRAAWIASLLVASVFTRGAVAAPLYTRDLDSLTYRATVVVEGTVTAARREFNDFVTVRVTAAYAGDVKAGASIEVSLGSHRKADEVRKEGFRGSFSVGGTSFGVGDELFLFLAAPDAPPAGAAVTYHPVMAGVKAVAGGKVTGMQQTGNPGPYQNVLDEGDAAAFRKKLEASVAWAAKFRTEFAKRKADAAWLVEQLAARPPLADGRRARDDVASDLCEALAATKDAGAIARAKDLRESDFERGLLNGGMR